MLVNGSKNEINNLYRGPSIDASYQVSYHLAKQFQRKSCFRNLPIRTKMTAVFVNGSKRNEQFPQRTFHRCFLPCFGSFGQAVSEQIFFRNRLIRNKNCMWRPCLLMERDKMRNLYREPYIDASYQVSVHLAKRFQRRFLGIDQLEKKNCLWQPYLLMDRDEMCNLYGRLPIDASFEFSVHLAKRFQRRRFVQKSTNQKQELSVASMFVNGSGRNQQS